MSTFKRIFKVIWRESWRELLTQLLLEKPIRSMVGGGLLIGLFTAIFGWVRQLPLESHIVLVGCTFVLAVAFVRYIQDGLASKCRTGPRKSPNLVFVKPDVNKAAIFDPKTGQVYGEAYFSKLSFKNFPIEGIDNRNAEDVAPHLEFWDDEFKSKKFEMVGRWSTDPGPAERGKAATEEVGRTIPPDGVPRAIGTVMKYLDDENCYGHNNEAPIKAPKDWRYTRYELQPGKYGLKVRFESRNVDPKPEFRFVLDNKGKGYYVTISPVGS